jgi:hypothetical protein
VSRRQLIVDCESTGLYPELGHIAWEWAVIERDTGAEHVWRIEADSGDLGRADPAALKISGYHERTRGMQRTTACDLADLADVTGAGAWSCRICLASHLAGLLAGATIIGAVPGFDERFLTAFLRIHGYRPPWPWHYRVRDIGSMAYGHLTACLALGAEGRDAALGVPSMDASTDDFARALGVDPERFDRHSALGDCRLVAAMLDVIEGRPGVTSGE